MRALLLLQMPSYVAQIRKHFPFCLNSPDGAWWGPRVVGVCCTRRGTVGFVGRLGVTSEHARGKALICMGSAPQPAVLRNPQCSFFCLLRGVSLFTKGTTLTSTVEHFAGRTYQGGFRAKRCFVCVCVCCVLQCVLPHDQHVVQRQPTPTLSKMRTLSCRTTPQVANTTASEGRRLRVSSGT